jgi:hypothetical protein
MNIVTDNSAVIAELNDRIEGLEKDKDALKVECYELGACNDALEAERPIRDLEQQAKGVNDFANKFCGDCKTLEQASVSYCADSFIKSLKEQGK